MSTTSKSIALVFVALFLTSLVTIFSAQPAHAVQEWTTQTISTNALSLSAIALDSNNFPHIAYTVYTVNYSPHVRDFVIYASWNGSSWVNQTVAEDASLCDLSLDSKGNAHILYKGINGAEIGLVCTFWTGFGWSRQTIDEKGFGGSLALDPTDNPHIAYFAYDSGTNAFLLKYARWTGSSWSTETVEVGDMTYLPSLKLDSQNYPHIMYETNKITPTTNLETLKYVTFSNASGWIMQTVGNNIEFTNMVLDFNGNPHFSHLTEGGLTDTSWNGATWSDQSANVKAEAESYLALDKVNHPRIEFINRTSGFLMYAKWSGTAWDIQTVDPHIAFTVGPIALDSEGSPHVCYPRYGHNVGEAPYNLIYATTTELTPTPSSKTGIFFSLTIGIIVVVLSMLVIFSLLLYQRHRKTAK